MPKQLGQKAIVQLQDQATGFWVTWSDSAKVIETDGESWATFARYSKSIGDYDPKDSKEVSFDDPYTKILWK